MNVNLKVVRIKSKLEEMYKNKIDLTDVESESEFPDQFYTRAIAAQAIIMRCGISEDVAGKCITDGYHDMGIDAVYNDITQKKLFFVQSKWRKEGTGGISQDEMNTFVEGIKRVINCEFEGCNNKLYAKKMDIEDAIRNMNYQIEMIFCHTGNQKVSDYALRPVKELLKHVNGGESDELLVFSEIQLQNIYEYLANGQNQNNIILDDVLLNNWGEIDAPIKAYYGTISACMILVLRAVESYIKENESNVTGRKKLVLIHGNRFLLHLALREIKNMDNFDDQYLDQEELRSIVNPICEKYWDKVYEIIEQYFPDAYPAYLFKNVGRLKEIIEKIQENNV